MKNATTTRFVFWHEGDQRFVRLVDIKKVQITDTTPYLPDALLMLHKGYFPDVVLETFKKFGWELLEVEVKFEVKPK